MTLIFKKICLTLAMFGVTSQTFAEVSSEKHYCYSAYHLKQQLNLSINYTKKIQRQKIKIDLDIHVKEITPSKQLFKNTNTKNTRTYIVLVRPNTSKVDGVPMDVSQRYNHPFLVVVNEKTGELIDLKSTVKDKSILSEYLSFFDLFQYSTRLGKYKYQNANGHYQAQISPAKNGVNQLNKVNLGYIEKNDKNKHLITESLMTLLFDKHKPDCFYKRAEGIERVTSTALTQAIVKTNASVVIESDKKRALPDSHFFYALNDNLESWPSFKMPEKISKKEAFAILPILMTKLSLLTKDKKNKTAFLNMMLSNSKVWPYLAEYILANSISDKTSLDLFWALDRIDSTESVNALTILATAPLQQRDTLRAALALGSTSAPFDEDNLERLQNHLINSINTDNKLTEQFPFIRLLGAMAKKRKDTAPLQSEKLKELLYSQNGMNDESVNAVVIDAIGNLGESIDLRGKNILLQNLSVESNKLRSSAVSAFKRIPYEAAYSNDMIKQLANERRPQIKNKIIEVLGRANRSDTKVKNQLLSLVKEPELSRKSLSSLKKINYKLKADDVELLESKLSHETDHVNQKLLASLILKHRRQQANKTTGVTHE